VSVVVLFGGGSFYFAVWYHENPRNHEAGVLDSRSNGIYIVINLLTFSAGQFQLL
jgi:hypothetical protein